MTRLPRVIPAKAGILRQDPSLRWGDTLATCHSGEAGIQGHYHLAVYILVPGLGRDVNIIKRVSKFRHPCVWAIIERP
ncbi:MAG: hypothetical protein HY586_06240 [Candidatus Omnitrophica bacterium]|nr:hypothetical protein [Candidatus Omnitrophota bacterium]